MQQLFSGNFSGKDENPMIQLFKNEWRKVRFPVLTLMLALSIIMCVLSCAVYRNYTLHYELEAWEVATPVFNLLFPLVVTLPLCWNLYYERKNNFLLYVRPRVRPGKYLAAKWLVQAGCAFLLIFIPYILAAVFSLYVKEPIDAVRYQGFGSPYKHVFLQIFTEKPMIYALLLSLQKGLIGVLVMTFGFVLALYVNNMFLILTGPFIYTELENFILSILGVPEYRLVVSFEPTAVASNSYSPVSVVFGPALLLLVCGVIWFYYAKIRKCTVVR